MKDEIKEIIIDQHWNYIIIGNEKYYDLPKRLLDYITNLQEKLDFMIDRNDEKQERIDKAIEYIKENCIDDEFYINLTKKEKNIFKVLDILNGDENESL